MVSLPVALVVRQQHQRSTRARRPRAERGDGAGGRDWTSLGVPLEGWASQGLMSTGCWPSMWTGYRDANLPPGGSLPTGPMTFIRGVLWSSLPDACPALQRCRRPFGWSAKTRNETSLVAGAGRGWGRNSPELWQGYLGNNNGDISSRSLSPSQALY